MKKYKVEVEWSGYSRGVAVYEVEAESKEEASDKYWSGEEISKGITRDDTEDEVTRITEITE